MQLLNEKVALVTGGSRGIGAAIVRKLAEHGAKVAFTYRSSKEKADALAAELSNEFNTTVKAFQSDAASFEQSEVLDKAVLDEFGAVHILVNNAGIQ